MNKEKFLELMSKAYDEKANIRLHFIYLKNNIDEDLLDEIQSLSIESGGNSIEEQSSEKFNRVVISNDEYKFSVSISSEIEQISKVV
ncbi:hypothetical protein [Rossellomorea vietnamensis]|uniref:hypothetical protein n=1 Tax=Rossellomorea vietnamensis TaxID=218284 RepID=UPI000553C086|nr:hypothetical protein [Rossellomorea vietnamensis]